MDDWLLPRWAVASVRLHLDVEDLILAVLLFDGIVMPTPANEKDFDRWKTRGWEPEEQEFRRINLGDLVYEVPWDEELRSDFTRRWEQMKKIGAESEALAYGLTPQVVAMKAWDDVFGRAQKEGRATQRPIPVAWYPHGASGESETAILDATGAQKPLAPVEREVGLLFRREIEAPTAHDPDEAVAAAVKLADSEEFVSARRALFVWELKVAGQDIPVSDAMNGLSEAARQFDELVRESVRPMATVRRGVRVLVPAGGSQAAHLTGVPLAGAVAGWGLKKVLARFVPLPPDPDPATDPGAALSMVKRRMSAVLAMPSQVVHSAT
jgi:hypothetical protein